MTDEPRESLRHGESNLADEENAITEFGKPIPDEQAPGYGDQAQSGDPTPGRDNQGGDALGDPRIHETKGEPHHDTTEEGGDDGGRQGQDEG